MHLNEEERNPRYSRMCLNLNMADLHEVASYLSPMLLYTDSTLPNHQKHRWKKCVLLSFFCGEIADGEKTKFRIDDGNSPISTNLIASVCAKVLGTCLKSVRISWPSTFDAFLWPQSCDWIQQMFFAIPQSSSGRSHTHPSRLDWTRCRREPHELEVLERKIWTCRAVGSC